MMNNLSLENMMHRWSIYVLGCTLLGCSGIVSEQSPAQQPIQTATVRLQELQTLSFPGEVETIHASGDGKRLVVGWNKRDNVRGGAQLLDATSLQFVGPTLEVGDGASNPDSRFTNDSKHLVTLSYKSTLRIWNSETGQLVGQGSEASWDWYVRCHPNNSECVTAGGHSNICRWSVPSGKLLTKTDTGFKRIIALDLAADGKSLAVIGRSGEEALVLQIRAYPSLKLSHEQRIVTTGTGVNCKLAIAPSGDRLAFTAPHSSPGVLYVVDMKTGKITEPVPVGFTNAKALQFLGDQQVMCHGWRRSPRIYDLATKTITVLQGVAETGGAGMCLTKTAEQASETRLLVGHGGTQWKSVSVWKFPLSKEAVVKVAAKDDAAPPDEPMPEAVGAADGPPKQRKAVPPKDALEKADAELRVLLSIDENGRIDPALSERLFKLANEEQDEAVRYAMLMMAADVAARNGNANSVRTALSRLTNRYQFERLRVAGRLLYDVRTRPLASDHKLQLAALSEELGDEALKAEQIDFASAFFDLSIEWSLRDRANLRRRRGKGQQVDALLPLYRKASPSRELLAKRPHDTEAHEMWGVYLCFVRGKWDEGLPLLLYSKTKELGDLAEADLAVEDDPKAWVELADKWADFAAKQDDESKKLGAHAAAAYWFSRASQKLTGLEKLRAEAKLKEQPTDPSVPARQ